jgi:hypothetical protein
MKDIIGNVWDMVDSFTRIPRHVRINEDKVSELAEKIKKTVEPYHKHKPWGPPNIPFKTYAEQPVRDSIVIQYELIAATVNYQYWYGRHDIRPNDSSAVKMYQLLDESCNVDPIWFSMDSVVDRFKKKLILNRFPAIEKRVKHLDELRNKGYVFARELEEMQRFGAFDLNRSLESLITTFPGFAEDMFLKRAFLFYIMLYMKMGWFEKEIDKVPVPADYQVPKMLRWFGCLDYSTDLSESVRFSIPIPENSLMECEIRASTMLVCKKLAEQSGCKTAEVDAFLWGNRKSCTDPFHLTVTTNY